VSASIAAAISAFSRTAATDLLPAKTPVEVFKAHTSAGGEVQLLKTHLVTRDRTHLPHEGSSDSASPPARSCLYVVQGPPVADQRMRITPYVQPAHQFAAPARH